MKLFSLIQTCGRAEDQAPAAGGGTSAEAQVRTPQHGGTSGNRSTGLGGEPDPETRGRDDDKGEGDEGTTPRGKRQGPHRIT